MKPMEKVVGIERDIQVRKKQIICAQLTELLKLTRQFEDIQDITYYLEDDDEYVLIRGGKSYEWQYRVCVTWDSEIAMIMDILNKIY